MHSISHVHLTHSHTTRSPHWQVHESCVVTNMTMSTCRRGCDSVRGTIPLITPPYYELHCACCQPSDFTDVRTQVTCGRFSASMCRQLTDIVRPAWQESESNPGTYMYCSIQCLSLTTDNGDTAVLAYMSISACSCQTCSSQHQAAAGFVAAGAEQPPIAFR